MYQHLELNCENWKTSEHEEEWENWKTLEHEEEWTKIMNNYLYLTCFLAIRKIFYMFKIFFQIFFERNNKKNIIWENDKILPEHNSSYNSPIHTMCQSF